MTFKTPQFWYDDSKLLPALLSPISAAYQLGHRINQNGKTPAPSPLPLICVGNAVAGGSGKTPTCIALKNLIGTDKTAFLTRGYKGSINNTMIVNNISHSHEEVGDEALLLSRHAMTIKSENRFDGLKLAKDIGAELVIMDDGLINNSVKKDLSIMVIDGAHGFGNGKTIPSGPLREGLETIFAKTDAFLIVNDDKRGIKAHLPTQKPVFSAKIVAKPHENVKKVYGFCGLGLPQKFKTTLEDCNYTIIGFHEFPDHHKYSRDDITHLKNAAEKNGAALITTEKDIVRIDEDLRDGIHVQAIEMVFDDPAAIKMFVEGHLSQ